MLWASAASSNSSLELALRETCDDIRDRLGGAGPDIAFVFASREHAESYSELPSKVSEALQPEALVGCSAGAVIGGGRELEKRPGLSITAGVLPGVDVRAFRLEGWQALGEGSEPAALQSLVGVSPEQTRALVLLPDPFTFDANRFLPHLDAAYPDSAKIGGLASGGEQPGENALFLNGSAVRSGLVGVALGGAIEAETIVAQGCRPIGDPCFVTACKGNALIELNERPVMEVLSEIFEGLDEPTRALFRHSLFLGFAMRETQTEFRQGDFLVRHLFGVDPKTKALLVGAKLEKTQIVQFHVRDAQTSSSDLEEALGSRRPAGEGNAPSGALLFSCLGRGEHLYGHPDHDTDLFRKHVGPTPLGGFFCNGEIGQVQEWTFLHGYTSAFALFRPR